jgi:hypothetical protein
MVAVQRDPLNGPSSELSPLDLVFLFTLIPTSGILENMGPRREREVRDAARHLLRDYWRQSNGLRDPPLQPEEFVRRAPELLVTEFLGLTLEKPEEINPEPVVFRPEELKPEIAGLLDRPARRIVIAQKYSLEWRRFTTAHELAHWILHPGEVLHRDRPMLGGERQNPTRPAVEQEADLFAAELLMPARLLQEIFTRCFGGPIRGCECDDALAFRLSSATGKPLTARHFAALAPMQRALELTRLSIYGQRVFTPLDKRFLVSPTAMAIQLLDLGLVS